MLSCVENLLAKERLLDGWTKDQLLVPFFGIEVGPNMLNFGVNSEFLNAFGVSAMHGSMIKRKISLSQVMKILKEEKESLLKLCEGKQPKITPVGLVKIGIVKFCENYELTIPLLKDKDKEIMTETVIVVAHEAAKEVISRYDMIKAMFKDLKYSKWLDGIGDFAEYILHAVMALSIEELVKREVLPKIPEEVPASWGMWAWSLPWTLDLKTLYCHGLEELRGIIGKRGVISDIETLARKGEYEKALIILKKAVKGL